CGADGAYRSRRPHPRQPSAAHPRVDRHRLRVREAAIGTEQRPVDADPRRSPDGGGQPDALIAVVKTPGGTWTWSRPTPRPQDQALESRPPPRGRLTFFQRAARRVFSK